MRSLAPPGRDHATAGAALDMHDPPAASRRAAAARHDLGAQAFGRVARAPNMERDRVAALRERKRDGAADSLRAAGD